MRTAFYPGSFDPMTNGHIHVLEQSLALCDRLVVGIGVHPGKTPMFSFDERAAMIAEALRSDFPARAADVEVVSFQGLVVEAAKTAGATVLVRGLRDGTDLDYEMQMAGMNRAMAPGSRPFLPRPIPNPATSPPRLSGRSPRWVGMSRRLFRWSCKKRLRHGIRVERRHSRIISVCCSRFCGSGRMCGA
jgi:pantetheine-phosphate adenylyltransferase